MSKNANPGELRTPVFFYQILRETDSEGVPSEVERNVFGDGKAVMCKWVNAHGYETFTAMQMQLREPATITCRYSPVIDLQQIVYRAGDRDAYEIISIDDVESRGQWLEIKVQRKEAAR